LVRGATGGTSALGGTGACGGELRDYRRLLERAIEGLSPGAPVQAALRAKLDAVLAEQDDRARMAAGA
jgi:hypothetical protein